MGGFRSEDAQQLLHNKFVVVLGDSIQRSVYKDLVKLLKDDGFLTVEQMRERGELTFENDKLIEGGQLQKMHNGTTYREVRQYRTGHHLVRFYFLTRVYSTYLESVLSDFQSGPQPDVLIVNSCIWDVNRYDDHHLEAYKTNLDILFQRLKQVLSPQCLIIWTMTMPVGYKHCEMPQNMTLNLRMDIVEGNFFSSTLADLHKMDVLDMHYHFRYNLRHRCSDFIHWNQLAHRKYTQILLTHIAQAWGVEAPKGNMLEGSMAHTAPPHPVTLRKDPYPRLHPRIREPCGPGAAYIPGYTSFDGSGINTMPGVLCPVDYTNENFISSEADSPFVNDSLLLTTDVTPGYFPPPPGPPFPGHPFTGGNFLFPNMPPPINYSPFPNYAPYPQRWNRRRKSKGVLKPRGGWMHPYR